jgi:hypothetical protein
LAPVSAFDIISSRAENILIGILCIAAVGMIASPELVSHRVTKLVKSMDQDLSDLLSICLRLKAAPHELNQAVKKLVSNAASIEDLRFGLGLEETGSGLTPANIEPFQLECLELASCALNLEAYFSSARHLPERTEPPCLIRALHICHETVTDLFQANRNSNDQDRYDRLQQQLVPRGTASARLPCCRRASGINENQVPSSCFATLPGDAIGAFFTKARNSFAFPGAHAGGV